MFSSITIKKSALKEKKQIWIQTQLNIIIKLYKISLKTIIKEFLLYQEDLLNEEKKTSCSLGTITWNLEVLMKKQNKRRNLIRKRISFYRNKKWVKEFWQVMMIDKSTHYSCSMKMITILNFNFAWNLKYMLKKLFVALII